MFYSLVISFNQIMVNQFAADGTQTSMILSNSMSGENSLTTVGVFTPIIPFTMINNLVGGFYTINFGDFSIPSTSIVLNGLFGNPVTNFYDDLIVIQNLFLFGGDTFSGPGDFSASMPNNDAFSIALNPFLFTGQQIGGIFLCTCDIQYGYFDPIALEFKGYTPTPAGYTFTISYSVGPYAQSFTDCTVIP